MENKTIKNPLKGFNRMICKEVNTKRFACWHLQHSHKISGEEGKVHSRQMKSLCAGAEVSCRVQTKHSRDTATTGCGASAGLHVPVSQFCLFHHTFLLQKLPSDYCRTPSVANHSWKFHIKFKHTASHKSSQFRLSYR